MWQRSCTPAEGLAVHEQLVSKFAEVQGMSKQRGEGQTGLTGMAGGMRVLEGGDREKTVEGNDSGEKGT